MPSAFVKTNINPLTTSPSVLAGGMETGSENCLTVGQYLADFEILGVIGEGGFGIVYLAFDHSLRRTVAIKEYMPLALARRGTGKKIVVRAAKHQDTFSAGLKSYINEARLLAQFDHPALVKVYRFWEENDTAYMAMQFYDGHTLKHLIDSTPELLTQAWLKSMLGPILAALDTLYSAQILHRDVSPENIIIQKNGLPVLLDFGSARQILAGMPQTLTVVLKPSYAPIEQYADDASMQQGPWTDIYALSAVIYKAIANKVPPSSVTRMIQDPIEWLAAGEYPEFSREFLAAIDKGLAVLPRDRPQSIAEFRKLLDIEEAPTLAIPAPTSLLFSTSEAKLLLPSLSANAIVRTVPYALLGEVTGARMVSPQALLKTREAHNVPKNRKPVVVTDKDGKLLRYETPEERQARKNAQLARATAAKVPPSTGTVNAKTSRRWPYFAVAGGILLAGIVGFMLQKSALDSNANKSVSRIAVAPLNKPALPLDAAVQLNDSKTASSALESAGPGPELTPPRNSAADKSASKTDEKIASDKLALDKKLSDKNANSGVTSRQASLSPPLKLAATLDPNESVVTDSANARQEAPVALSAIKLSIKPWGTVIINGSVKGVSPPLKTLTLAEGKYKVKIRNPNFPDYSTELIVTKKKPGFIQHDFSP